MAEVGHLKCVIRPKINCLDHTISLEAWKIFLFTGVEEPVVAEWNTGDNLHKIIVTEGGTYSWDDSGQGCDHHDNTITVPDFFDGPLVISGPTVICPNELYELEINNPNYNFVNYTWNPNLGGSISPIQISAPGNYSLTVTDQNGCTYTDNHVVQQSPPVLPFINGPFVMCSQGDSAILNVTGGAFATYSWDHGPTTQSVTVYEPGVYAVTVTNNLGCTGTTLINVDNGDVNGQAILASQPSICPGQSDTLWVNNNSYISYKWSTGQTTKKIVVNTPGTYTVTVTNIHGCTGTAIFTIQAVQPPAPQIVAPVLCPGGTATLTINGGPFPQYIWSTGASSSSIGIAGPGIFTVTVSNSIGCTGTSSVNVSTASPPLLAITGPSTACPGQSATLSATAGYPTYLWSNSASAPAITVNQSGLYTVTVTDNNGCTNSAVQNFNITTAPVPVVTVAPYACDNQMTLSADAGYPGYTWSTGATSQSIQVQTGGAYTVTVSAGIGCTGSTTQQITIPANPQVSISGTSQFCAGASGTLQATAGFQQYQWSTGSIGNSLNITNGGTYTVTVTDNNNCTATDIYQVTANPLPQPAINGPLAICQGNSTQWSVSTNFDQYQWSTGNSGQAITITQSGPYTVTVTDLNGCTGIATQNLTVNASLSTQITTAPYACDNLIQLTAGSGFSTYSWSNGASTQSASALSNGTYTVTITDVSGCTGTATGNVTIPANPVVTVLGPTQICQGGTAILNANGAFAQYNWSNGSTGAQLSVTNSGDFTVTVTDNNGCTSTAQHTVNFGTSLSISVAVAPYACDNQLTLTPGQGFATYNWSNGANTPSISVQGNGTYTVTVTDATGCTGTTDQAISIPTNPAVSVSGPAQLCFGTTGVLQASGTFNQYAWSNGFASSGLTVSQSGSYTVVVTDNNGCTASASAAVTVLPQVTPVISGPSVICPGASAQFVTTTTFAQYAWSTGATMASIAVSNDGDYTVTVTDNNGCTGTDFQGLNISMPPAPMISVAPYACNNIIALAASAGYNTYTWSNGGVGANVAAVTSGNFTVTVTDALGCTGTATQAVNIPSNPNVTLSGPAQVCAGSGAQFLASGAYPQYIWNNGNTGNSITLTQSGNISVTVTDVNGCTATASANLNVLPPVVPTITGPGIICPNTSASFNAGNGYILYNWSTGASTPVISASVAGNYTVTVTDNNGCTGTDVQNLNISIAPAPVITVSPYTCNNTLALSANTGFVSYNWSNTSSTAGIVAQSNGTYTVTVSDALGCTGTAVQNITIPVNPQVGVSGPAAICAGDQAVYQASGQYPQYLWSGGQTGNSITISQSGNYIVTVTDNNGCTAIGSQALTVHALSVTKIEKISCFVQDTGSIVQLLSNQFGCDSTVTTHTALSPPVSAAAEVTSSYNGLAISCSGSVDGAAKVTPQGGVAPFVFQWSNNTTNAAVQNIGAGVYSVTVTDANGCTATSTISLEAPEAILPALEPMPVACFIPGAVEISQVTGGTQPFRVECNDEVLEKVKQFPVQFEDLEPGVYTVLITDANGCTATQTFELEAPDIQTVLPLDSFWVDAGVKVRIKAPAGYNPLSISWAPSTGLSCDDCPITEASVFETTQYQVILQGYGNCRVEKQFIIKVRPPIYVPNVIMPGSDDNYLFTVYAGKGYLNVRVLRVFTRWGELVREIFNFAPNGPVGWEGDYRGAPVNPGVYVYYAEVVNGDGQVVVLKGDVTVIR